MKLSFVFCSRSHDIPESLRRNVISSCGFAENEFEFVVIDNSANDHSIFEAYEEGVRRAQGDVICFIHEAILFRTDGWGKTVIDAFADPTVGLLGVAGSHFLPKCRSTWFAPEMRSDNFIQGFTKNGVYSTVPVCHDKWRTVSRDLVCVDGLFICIRASLFGTIAWDTKTFSGFHCYDTDISLQVINAGFRVVMSWDILIEHKSSGVFSASFYDSLKLLNAKWSAILPLVRGVEMSDGEIEARTRMVELKREIQELKWSREYAVGSAILRPLKRIGKLFGK